MFCSRSLDTSDTKTSSSRRGSNVSQPVYSLGIIGFGFYFPKRYLALEDLEIHDSKELGLEPSVLSGKYTLGLGQRALAVPEPNEDAVSMAMNAVEDLFKSNHVESALVSHVFVGTESSVDGSKSIKSYLMDNLIHRFGISPRVEGVDCINACYGGTAALLAAYDAIALRCYSSIPSYAIVVTTDIAVYSSVQSRPAGGAGSIAMLIGPDAPLKLIRDLTQTYNENIFDFYKPSFTYPVVDGKLSVRSYLNGLINTKSPFTGDYYVYHSPFTKMVMKAHAVRLNKKCLDNDFMKQFMEQDEFRNAFIRDVEPSCYINREIGNSYTSSVYFSLISLLRNNLNYNTSIIMYSYGSGCISSSLRFEVHGKINSMRERVDILLKNRERITAEEYVDYVKNFKNGPKTVCGGKGWRIKSIDNFGRRTYVFL